MITYTLLILALFHYFVLGSFSDLDFNNHCFMDTFSTLDTLSDELNLHDFDDEDYDDDDDDYDFFHNQPASKGHSEARDRATGFVTQKVASTLERCGNLDVNATTASNMCQMNGNETHLPTAELRKMPVHGGANHLRPKSVAASAGCQRTSSGAHHPWLSSAGTALLKGLSSARNKSYWTLFKI
jgi:hypothetical protein